MFLVVTQAVPASGQASGAADALPWVENFEHDGRITEWRSLPPARVIEASPGHPQLLIWFGQSPGGLVVAGELRDGPVPPPLHVTVSGAENPELPPFGWGHQFGYEVLEGPADCERSEAFPDASACTTWIERQSRHRARLVGLFRRVWRVDLGGREAPSEVAATPTFAELPDPGRLASLAPQGRVEFQSADIRGTEATGFEFIVPWSAFPPVPAPDLESVRIEASWEADPSTMPVRALARPLSHYVTPCRSGLAGVLIPGSAGQVPRAASEDAVVYMTPDPTGDLRRLIVLDHHAEGYQYAPSGGTLAPQAYVSDFDVLDLGAGVRLCTPHLTLGVEGERRSPADWTVTGEGDPWGRYAELRDLQVRRLEDGKLLVLNGPKVSWSYFGSGQCGACPRVSVDVYVMDPRTGAIDRVLAQTDVAEPESRDVEIEVSPDWTEVTIFRSETDWSASTPEVRWSSTRWCRPATSGAYEMCGEEANVPEPPVRLRARYVGR